jgi:hypothetical protein
MIVFFVLLGTLIVMSALLAGVAVTVEPSPVPAKTAGRRR